MSIFRQMFALSHFNRLKVHLSDQLCTLVMISADPKPIMITPHNGAELFQKLHFQFNFSIIFNYLFQDIRSNTNLRILHLLFWIYFTQKTICNSLKKRSILYKRNQDLMNKIKSEKISWNQKWRKMQLQKNFDPICNPNTPFGIIDRTQPICHVPVFYYNVNTKHA